MSTRHEPTDVVQTHPAPTARPVRGVERTLAGWSNYDRQACQVYRPEKVAELRRVVAGAPQDSVLSRGAGRSYNDAALNGGGGVLLHARLNRLLDFDPASGELKCEAGATFGEIIDFALPRGWFPSVTPGTKFVTVGGAIAADVHGKNHHQDGSFASCVASFRLLTADGRELICSRSQHSDAFWGTLGGMGLTGVVLDARLSLKPAPTAYLAVEHRRAENLDQALDEFAAHDHRFAYSVAWIDCLAKGKALGRSILMRGRHAPLNDLPRELVDSPRELECRRKRSVPFYLPQGLLNRWTVQAFNSLYYRVHRDQRAIVHYDSFFYPLDSVLHWNRIYGRQGFIQYQAAFPVASSRRGVAALLEKLAGLGAASFLAVLKSFGPGNASPLSFSLQGHTLALDLPWRRDLPELMRELDELVLRYDGRTYLAKNPRLSRTAFEAMYPETERFRRIKNELDPQHRFSSSLARRLGLTEAARTAVRAA
ncbi:MAG TPA: FAD-binding oxidoreductase [Pirellulales bacterium]|nr:FAD-binding oxidoreductase [Pirellulales bacterium]